MRWLKYIAILLSLLNESKKMTKLFTIILFPLFSLFSFSAFAQEKVQLTIYAYDSFTSEWGPGPQIKQKFEQICDCEVKFVSTTNSISALRKIQLEGEQTKADILLGIDSSISAQAEKTALFEEHKIDLSQIKIPANYSSHYFVPFDYGYFAFIYNKEKLDNPPTSFEDIIKNNIKIIIQDPRSSTVGNGLVLWVKALYGEMAKDIWQKLSPQIITMTKGWSQSYNLFLKGEADMVLSYTTSPAYHQIVDNDFRYLAAQFSGGHYLQIEVAGIVKYSKNKQLARQFLQFLISKQAQEIIPTTNWMYPVIEGVLPAGYQQIYKPEIALLLDEEEILANSANWISEMLDGLK